MKIDILRLFSLKNQIAIKGVMPIITAFRTPFWLEDKRWYAKFQYVVNNEGPLFVITSLVNESVAFFRKSEKKFIQFFTFTRKEDDGSKIRNVWNAILNLSDITEAISFRQVGFIR